MRPAKDDGSGRCGVVCLCITVSCAESGPWSDSGIESMARFVKRVETLVEKALALPEGTKKIESSDSENIWKDVDNGRLLKLAEDWIGDVIRITKDFEM